MDTTKGILSSSMGQNGLVVASAGTYTDDYISILALEESIITATGDNITDFTSVTIPAGVNIPGVFTSVVVTSGTVILYKGIS